jgi:hypothetical protein
MMRKTEGQRSIPTIDEVVCSTVEISEDASPEKSSADIKASIPLILQSINYSKIKPIPPPEINQISSNHLWGQFNRIFPVKVGLRSLAGELSRSETELIDLNSFRNGSAEMALKIGTILDALDNKLGNKRGSRLSTGLPSLQKDKLSSMSRFRNQFIGYLRKDGRMEGMSCALKFISIKPGTDGKLAVGISPMGLEFCKLKNSIIDLGEHDRTLSSDESKFIVRHIIDELPKETEFMMILLSSIKHGADTAQKIVPKIGFQTRDEQNVLATDVNGCLGRMSELGLLEKSTEGMSTIYSITKFAREVLPDV